MLRQIIYYKLFKGKSDFFLYKKVIGRYNIGIGYKSLFVAHFDDGRGLEKNTTQNLINFSIYTFFPGPYQNKLQT